MIIKRTILAAGLWIGLSAEVHAQGILPPARAQIGTSSATASALLLISQPIPDALTVTDLNGGERTLLSYKTPLDLLVVFFLSPDCPASRARWADVRRFYTHYRSWRVSFVAISAGEGSAAQTLNHVLQAESLDRVPVVRDPAHRVQALLAPEGAPWLAVIGEDARLQFRGPLQPMSAGTYMEPAGRRTDPYAAMDALIGHIGPVLNPDPGGQGSCPWP